MTRTALGATGLLLASTSLAMAGALDRSGQGIGIIFEEGNVVELSYGYVAPSVNGTFTDPVTGATAESGDVGADYNQVALAFKYDVTDRLSVAFILDQPFGADVDYGDGDATYPLVGSRAEFRTTGITAVGRYRFNDAFSLHAGVRRTEVDADLLIQSGGYIYDADFEADADQAYLVGVAYERPAIALRVALTYATATSHEHDTTYTGTFAGAGVTAYELPESVNLEAQTGIAPGTLLFGSIRWADWSETEINVPGYLANPVVGYDEDVYTYTLGVGRQLTDRFSGAVSVTYESEEGDLANNLAPTDGSLGFSVGGTYVIDQIEVTGGVRYVRLGDATTNTILAEFEDNDAVALGLSVAYRF